MAPPTDLGSGLEEFDRITVRIFDLDLFAAGAYFDLVPEMEPGLLQHLNQAAKIRYLKHNPVPSAGLLLTAIWHRTRTRGSMTTKDKFEISD
jgi:hypothetical protein